MVPKNGIHADLRSSSKRLELTNYGPLQAEKKPRCTVFLTGETRQNHEETALGKFNPTEYHWGRRQRSDPDAIKMFKNRNPDVPKHTPDLAGGDHPAESTTSLTTPEKTEKGSLLSMWELLLQMRVLLPYLARLVPLLDRGLVKAAPDLTDLRAGMVEMQTGNRDLEVQARNQALQLERIEQQMARLRVLHENAIEDNRRLVAGTQSLRRLVLIFGIGIVLLILASWVAAFLLIHP